MGRSQAESGAPMISDIRQKLALHHELQLGLCERLESIADNLPDSLDSQECLQVSQCLFPVIHEAHQFEEQMVFPVLNEMKATRPSISDSLERLKFEHWEDESLAEDISETLSQFVRNPDQREAEKLSYMLRGFFDGIRRHIAFEMEYLIPYLEETG